MWEILKAIFGFGFGSGTLPIPLVSNLDNEVEYYSNAIWPNTLLDLNTLYTAKLRGALTEDEFEWIVRQLGYDAKEIEYYEAAQKAVVDVQTAIQLDLQKRLTSDIKTAALSKNDVPENVYDVIKQANEWWPSPSLMQEWLNRDIFNPETVKKYSLDSYWTDGGDIDQKFEETGVPQEWRKALWLASWNYPSFYEGKYMYDWWRAHPDTDTKLNPDHLKFDLSDFMYLMRVSNYPEYFQKLYAKILANPLTYHELGEMYHYGIIDESEIDRYLKWAGYDDEEVEKMHQLFLNMYAPDGKKKSKTYTLSVIAELYEHGKLHKTDFEKYMKELGYTSEAVKIYTEYLDLKKELAQEKQTITEIEYEVKNHELTTENAYQKLIKNGVQQGYAAYLTDVWQLRYSKRHKAFPLSDLMKLAELKAISEDDFAEELKLDGYSEKQITWFKIMAGYQTPPKK